MKYKEVYTQQELSKIKRTLQLLYLNGIFYFSQQSLEPIFVLSNHSCHEFLSISYSSKQSQ